MKKYTQTDRQLHQLSQIIARANRSYVPEKEDDSHTTLYYDAVGHRLTGRWLETPSGKFILSLNLADFHFQWLNDRLQVVHSVAALPETGREIEQEVVRFFGDKGMDTDPFFEPLHFEIPKYDLQPQGIAGVSKEGVGQWKHFRKLANTACNSLLGFLQASGEVRIWPHHFDTGLYAPIDESLGIGFGLAMEDEMAGRPYFYLAGYALQGTIEYEGLPPLSEGRWEINEHWKGAVLPLTELSKKQKKSEQKIFRFMLAATAWFLDNAG